MALSSQWQCGGALYWIGIWRHQVRRHLRLSKRWPSAKGGDAGCGTQLPVWRCAMLDGLWRHQARRCSRLSERRSSAKRGETGSGTQLPVWRHTVLDRLWQRQVRRRSRRQARGSPVPKVGRLDASEWCKAHEAKRGVARCQSKGGSVRGRPSSYLQQATAGT